MSAHPETRSAPFVQILSGHFRERAGYSCWRTRGTSDYLLIYTLSGRGRIGLAPAPGSASRPDLIVASHDIVLISPGTLHDYAVEPSLSRWELLWAHFRPRPHWIDLLRWPEIAPGVRRLQIPPSANRPIILKRLRDVRSLACGALRRREEFAMNALEEFLLRCDMLNPASLQPHADPRIQAAMDFACRHFDRPITLQDLSETAGLSSSRFCHLFKSETGDTPQRFIEQQRMARATQLIELTPRSIQEIARAVGYDSAFYFSLRFKRLTGLSPRAYRRRTQRR